MSFKNRLLAIFSVIMAITGGSTLYVGGNLYFAQAGIERNRAVAESIARHTVPLLVATQELKSDIVQVQQFLSDISATQGQDGLDDGFANAAKSAESFQRNLDKARQSTRALGIAEIGPALDALAAAFPPYYENGQRMAKAYMAGGPAAGNPIMPEFDATAARLAEATDRLTAIVTADTGTRTADLTELARAAHETNSGLLRFLITGTAIGVIFVFGGCGYLFWLISSSFSALRHDIDLVRTMGADDGMHLRPERHDEFGHVGEMLREIVVNRRQLEAMSQERLALQQQAEHDRYTMQRKMLRSLVQAAVLGNEAMISLSKMKRELDLSADEVQTMAHSVEQMRGAISAISDDSNDAAIHAGDAGSAADNGLGASREALAAFARIVAAVNDAGAKVQDLSLASRHIGQIITDIESVAGQTNLLALNATIEAARAGEAGKGFAVVANEVKTLANQTARATDDIRQRIAELQTEMEQIVGAMADSTTTVAEGQAMVSSLGGQLQGIAERVGAVRHRMSDISSVLEQQTNAAADLAQGTHQVAELTRCNETQLEKVLQDMARMSEHLDGQVGSFANLGSMALLVEIAKNDHVAFKRRILDGVLGRTRLAADQVPDHHTCRLGKWYDSLTEPNVTGTSQFKAVMGPHERVHAVAKKALTLAGDGKVAEALEALEEMNQVSHDIVDLLEALGTELHRIEDSRWSGQNAASGQTEVELFT